MGPVQTSKFRKFLTSKGLKHIRTKASHEIWSRKDLLRPVVFQGAKKQIPEFHIRTNLKTLEVSEAEFLLFLENL